MTSQTRHRPQPQLRTFHRPTPEQVAAVHKVVLRCREEWRQEMTARKDGPAGVPTEGQTAIRRPRRNGKAEFAKRAAFASAVARTELGRHYWDERRHRLPFKPPRRVNGQS